MSRLSVGVDVGGTRTKIGLVDAGGMVVAEAVHATVLGDGEAFRARIAIELAALAERAGAGRDRLGAVGLAVPGFADAASGTIAQVWEQVAYLEAPGFAASIARTLGLPCVVLNDARAAALGEARCGAGVGARRILALTVGTGLGFAFVVDGDLRDSAPLDHMAGHIPVGAPAAPCCCGSAGCLESAVRAEALVRVANAHGGAFADAEAVCGAAAAGDAAAAAAIDAWIASFARGLDTYCWILAPERVVIGGGAAAALAGRLDRLGARLTARPLLGYRVELAASRLGTRAGVIGAALMAAAAVASGAPSRAFARAEPG